MKCIKWVLPLFFVLSACEDDSPFDVEPRQATRPYVTSTGYSVIVQMDLPKQTQHARAAAELFKEGQSTVVEGGNIFTVKSGSKKGLLNAFGDSRYQYAGSLEVGDASQGVQFFMQYLPVEARKDRFYPADLAYVDTDPADSVGLDFSVNFPPSVTINAPASSTRIIQASDDIVLQWAYDQTRIDQVEIGSYMHCLGEYKVIYRGTGNQTKVTVANMLDSTQPHQGDLVKKLVRFIFIGAILGLEKPKQISECDIDFVFAGLKYTNLSASSSPAAIVPLTGGVSVMSRSEKARIQFKPTTPYTL